MDRGVAVFGHDTLADQNRVFEVVAVPGHKRHQHVLTQSEFAQISRCAVSDHVAFCQLVTALDDGALVNVGVLVGTLVLDQVVDVHTDLTGLRFRVVHTDHNTGCIHVVHHAAAGRGNHGARVDRRHTLNTGADKRFFRTQNRHGLALHVGTHQGTVRVVVLQERHQGCRNRHDLRRRHVHVLHAFGTHHDGLAFFAGGDQIACEHSVLVQRRVGLGDHVFAFLDGRQIVDIRGDLAVHHTAIRRFNETVLVEAGV